MIIEKILNNNVIIIVDPKTKKEKILMGNGLAFKKKVGQEVEEDKIEKIFVIDNRDDSDKFKKLIEEIPLKILEVTDDIVKFAEEKLNRVLDKHIYVALADHMAFAIKRLENNILVQNSLLVEIKRVHKEEYDIGLWAVKYINEKLDTNLPIDEAGFFALHIVNASYSESGKETILMTSIVRDVLNIVRYFYSVEFIEDDLNYDRLLTHLKFFAKRVLTNNQHYNGQNAFIDLVKEKYYDAYLCTQKIKDYIGEAYHYDVTDDEAVYLSLHIHRVISVIKETIQ